MVDGDFTGLSRQVVCEVLEEREEEEYGWFDGRWELCWIVLF